MYASLYDFFRDQGSIVAGLLALVAAYLTIRVTREMADRTIKATRETADREISAAQDQTKVAQEQIAATLRIERRRSTSEAWAFYVALEAAMAIVIEDIAAARAIFGRVGAEAVSQMAYRARQRITKAMFPELRTGLLRLGGQLTAPFVSLDNKIDSFAAEWTPAQSPGGLQFRNGIHAGLTDELDQIEREAKSLRKEAGAAIKRCLKELAALAP
jgi:hypothetical protein